MYIYQQKISQMFFLKLNFKSC